MFDVTPKFLATLKATPTAELKMIKERALTTIERPADTAYAIEYVAARSKKVHTVDSMVEMINQVVSEINKVLRARGCTL